MRQKKITLQNKEIKYNLKKSKKARRARLTIHCDGNFVVTIPSCFPETSAEIFIREKSDWVIKKLKYFENFKENLYFHNSKRDYKQFRETAFWLAKERVNYYSQFYGYSFNRICIRNQKTRWGSCSRNGNLNFNYKIALLPRELCDYIIVHELCHLGEFNHSENFWKLVGNILPNYEELRRRVKSI